GLSSDNYVITYESGDLTIDAASLTIAANDLTIVFGEDPGGSLSVTYTGFVNGDGETDLTGTLSFASITETDATSTPYTDVIIPSGLSSDNYMITYESADLTINKAPQVIIFGALEEQNIAERRSILLTATGGGSGERVTYISSDESVVEMDGPFAEFVGTGTVTITASQAGNENYEEAVAVAQTLTVIEEYIWRGTLWNNGTRGPVPNRDVIIEADFSTADNGTFEAANLEIAENVTLTIHDENAIIVNESLRLDGDVTLNSGGVLALYGDVTGTGQLTAHREVTPSLGYSIVGTTVGNVGVSTLSAAPDFVYGYDGTNFTIPTVLEAGSGYFVAYDESNPLFMVSGTPSTLSVDVPLTYSDDGNANNDFNLLANPYNAAISRQDFVDSNVGLIDGVTYYWQDGGTNLSNGTRAGNYVTVTANGTASGGTFDGDIRSAQGFFVRAVMAAEATFDAEFQVTGSTSNTDEGFFRQEASNKLRLNITDGISRDETVLQFSASGTTAFDQGLDAHKFMNPSLSLYSLGTSTPLAIQALPEVSAGMHIPLGYQTLEPGEVQFSVDLSEFADDVQVHLFDQMTQTRLDLRANPTTTIMLSSSSENDRFVLEINPTVLNTTEEQLSNMLVYGNSQKLNILAPITGDHEVAIFSLDGKQVYREIVRFESGRAILYPTLRVSRLYLLNLEGEHKKIILKD
ncbi:MAG: MBG domain-containing protein, partial [Bacteroidota bacterium]